MALTTNLISYWKLDESSGSASDSVGSNTLTNNNTITYSPGKINNGANFVAASTQYFSSSIVPNDANITIALWFKTTATATQELWGHDSTGGSGWSRRLTMNNAGSGKLELFYTNVGESGQVTFDSTGTYNDGAWHYAVFTLDSSLGGALYIDGTALTTGHTYYAISGGTNSNLMFGRNNNGGSPVWYLTGSLDEIGYWNRAITSTEVTQLYNGGAGLQYPFTGTTYSAALTGLSFSLSLGSLGVIRSIHVILSGIFYTLSLGSLTAGIGRLYAATLTGIKYILSLGGLIAGGNDKWTNESKHTSSYSDQAKNSSAWIDQNKN